MTDTSTAAPAAAYTEREAAKVLGINPQKLRYWRQKGYLAAGVVLEPFSPPMGKRQTQRYSAAAVDAAVGGPDTLFKAAS